MDKMNERVFVDANYFVALFNPEDSLHQNSTKIAAELKARNAQFVISNLIFGEIMTIVSMRRGRAVARMAGNTLMQTPGIEMTIVDEFLHTAAWNIFEEVEQKNISFVDCSSIAIMQSEAIGAIVTFDKKDFTVLRKQYHFRVIN